MTQTVTLSVRVSKHMLLKLTEFIQVRYEGDLAINSLSDALKLPCYHLLNAQMPNWDDDPPSPEALKTLQGLSRLFAIPKDMSPHSVMRRKLEEEASSSSKPLFDPSLCLSSCEPQDKVKVSNLLAHLLAGTTTIDDALNSTNEFIRTHAIKINDLYLLGGHNAP